MSMMPVPVAGIVVFAADFARPVGWAKAAKTY
jgi:hypothetical protein